MLVNVKGCLRWASALALCCAWCAAQATPLTYVVNRDDSNVSVVDVVNKRTVTTIPAGMAMPQEIAISPDGCLAYLSSVWSATIAVLDLGKHQLLAGIPLNQVSNGVVFSPSGALAYIDTNTPRGGAIAVIDTATHQLVRTFPVSPHNTRGMAIHPDGSRLYALEQHRDPDVGQVAVIDPSSGTVLERIGVGTDASDIQVHPAGTLAYVVNRESRQAHGTVTVINTRTHTVAATVAVGKHPSRVAFHPAGNQAYVTNSGDGTVSVIDTASHAVVGVIEVDQTPQHVVFHPAGTHAYVSNPQRNSLSIIDTATQEVHGAVTVGSAPWGVALASNGLETATPQGTNGLEAGSVVAGKPIPISGVWAGLLLLVVSMTALHRHGQKLMG
ncbi:YncE family protein [Comamonas squillarum]|uniref:YncE family protein n=1 Tax=Comamonas squillarum TaxID=2977320 RepID=A0ABY5ZZI0_9BURK|nr:YncE family protein [Comamonas sp. PR12]UXC19417.1 YncE family protein [Comamonas sp. PR12]